MSYWATFAQVLKLQRWPVIDPEEIAEQERQARINKLTGNKKTPPIGGVNKDNCFKITCAF